MVPGVTVHGLHSLPFVAFSDHGQKIFDLHFVTLWFPIIHGRFVLPFPGPIVFMQLAVVLRLDADKI
jgi:hypothetical protein